MNNRRKPHHTTIVAVILLIGLAAGLVACGTDMDDPLDTYEAVTGVANLVANPSLETVNATKPSEPVNWRPASWGTNTATLKYDATDANSGARSVRIDVPSWSSGDAKWIFDSVTVTPGTPLIYRDYYKSTVTTKLVAAYQMVSGTTTYVTLLAKVPASATWSTVAVTLLPPANASRVTVYHLIAAVGTLQLDDVSLAPPQTPDTSSGVPNGSLEQVADLDLTLPLAWRTGSWGSNSASFAHAQGGHTGDRSVSLTISNYVSGDAKWYFDPQPVTAGMRYQFSDYYVATAASFISVRLTMSDSTFRYVNLGQVPAAPSFVQVRAEFLVPSGAVAATVFHGLSRNGTLQIDDAALVNASLAVAQPIFSPASGTYNTDQSVTISCETSGATIHYTTDGTTPTTASPVYSTPIAVTGPNTTMTIRAIAVKDQIASSAVQSMYSVTYLPVDLLTLSPAPGTYNADQSVTIGCETSGATIHYTTDGTTPTTSSPIYSTPIYIAGPNTTTTIRAIAVKDQMVTSAAEGTYAVTYVPVATPTLNPAPGTYDTDQSVTISCRTSGATIHYTTDGTEPTASSPVYSTPISIAGPNTTTTIRAVAVKDQMLNSAVQGVYTVTYRPPSVQYRPTPKVIFTFDVSSRALYERALPIFAAHGMPAVIFAETALMNSGESWVLSWQQLRDLQNVYGWEVGSHTINHPYLTQVSDAQLDQELRDSKSTLIANGLNITTFASPYGAYDLRVMAAAAKYYESHRAAWGGPNVWPDIYNDYEMKCYELDVHEDGAPTVADVKLWIETAIAYKHTLVILLHEIVPGTPQMYEYNANDLNTILDYIATRPIQVTTMTAALQYSANANLVSNPSFTTLSNGWATDWQRSDTANITIDENNHGSVSGAAGSAKIVGGATQRELTSAVIPVSSSGDYLLRMYQNVQNLTAGGWSVAIEELDANDAMLGGQLLGSHSANFVGNQYYEYRPTFTAVARIRIKIYAAAGSQLTLYVDSVELKQVN